MQKSHDSHFTFSRKIVRPRQQSIYACWLLTLAVTRKTLESFWNLESAFYYLIVRALLHHRKSKRKSKKEKPIYETKTLSLFIGHCSPCGRLAATRQGGPGANNPANSSSGCQPD
jgi:hypothetical protein